MIARTAALLLGLGALALTACAPQAGPCSGPRCHCSGGNRCDYSCGVVAGCVADCESLDACYGDCADGCQTTCHDATTCDLACGADCTADCHSASSCTIDCGADCDATCTSVSMCSVRMVSGVARCTSVGGCDIRCGSGAASTPATDCGGGVWACGACP